MASDAAGKSWRPPSTQSAQRPKSARVMAQNAAVRAWSVAAKTIRPDPDAIAYPSPYERALHSSASHANRIPRPPSAASGSGSGSGGGSGNSKRDPNHQPSFEESFAAASPRLASHRPQSAPHRKEQRISQDQWNEYTRGSRPDIPSFDGGEWPIVVMIEQPNTRILQQQQTAKRQREEALRRLAARTGAVSAPPESEAAAYQRFHTTEWRTGYNDHTARSILRDRPVVPRPVGAANRIRSSRLGQTTSNTTGTKYRSTAAELAAATISVPRTSAPATTTTPVATTAASSQPQPQPPLSARPAVPLTDSEPIDRSATASDAHKHARSDVLRVRKLQQNAEFLAGGHFKTLAFTQRILNRPVEPTEASAEPTARSTERAVSDGEAEEDEDGTHAPIEASANSNSVSRANSRLGTAMAGGVSGGSGNLSRPMSAAGFGSAQSRPESSLSFYMRDNSSQPVLAPPQPGGSVSGPPPPPPAAAASAAPPVPVPQSGATDSAPTSSATATVRTASGGLFRFDPNELIRLATGGSVGLRTTSAAGTGSNSAHSTPTPAPYVLPPAPISLTASQHPTTSSVDHKHSVPSDATPAQPQQSGGSVPAPQRPLSARVVSIPTATLASDRPHSSLASAPTAPVQPAAAAAVSAGPAPNSTPPVQTAESGESGYFAAAGSIPLPGDTTAAEAEAEAAAVLTDAMRPKSRNVMYSSQRLTMSEAGRVDLTMDELIRQQQATAEHRARKALQRRVLMSTANQPVFDDLADSSSAPIIRSLSRTDRLKQRRASGSGSGESRTTPINDSERHLFPRPVELLKQSHFNAAAENQSIFDSARGGLRFDPSEALLFHNMWTPASLITKPPPAHQNSKQKKSGAGTVRKQKSRSSLRPSSAARVSSSLYATAADSDR